jgi:hypothetical protein
MPLNVFSVNCLKVQQQLVAKHEKVAQHMLTFFASRVGEAAQVFADKYEAIERNLRKPVTNIEQLSAMEEYMKEVPKLLDENVRTSWLEDTRVRSSESESVVSRQSWRLAFCVAWLVARRHPSPRARLPPIPPADGHRPTCPPPASTRATPTSALIIIFAAPFLLSLLGAYRRPTRPTTCW